MSGLPGSFPHAGACTGSGQVEDVGQIIAVDRQRTAAVVVQARPCPALRRGCVLPPAPGAFAPRGHPRTIE
ncbi:hypothetical protein [Kineococcus xinjiangensis]|uniref:hypothetical protein n=1 Tax=Kineococcus xinjiangensis TaxID=512762 RepID=UPI0011AFD9E4|nr:hypothetical protein [Kineococcus xinjiangensis]